jgi:uncharacterized protein YjiS (DUF1127 family)
MLDQRIFVAVPRPRPSVGLGTLFALIRVWRRRRRERAYLLTLDDRCLRDIGITRWDAAREYEKPFWKA